MVSPTRHKVSLQFFESFIQQPDNLAIDYEYISGEIVPVVSNNYSSIVAMVIGGLISVYVYQNELGYVTGADGGYHVGDERYIPDVGFISKKRQPEPSEDAYNPNSPDLVVEVISPTDDEKLIRLKVANYLAHNVTIWLIDPDEEHVEVYKPYHAPYILNDEDMLKDDELLLEFEVRVGDLFPKRKNKSI